jgi:hypothetical protein
VEEHGYEWGVHWGYRIVLGDEGGATVHLWDSDENRLRARVAVELPPDRAAFNLAISLENPTDRSVRYQFWNNAMLAPGAGNQPSEALQFVFPVSEMTVHSTGDARLPGAGAAFSWPVYQGRDVSRLETWREYLGFFERPAAQGDFVGVYDQVADEGIVRVYPSGVARGAKGFAFGWGDAAIPAENWTDDGSGYVELHGGVTPTFDEWAELGPGQTLEWREAWYPVIGLGGILHAEPGGAVNVQPQTGGLQVSLFSTRRLTGRLVVTLEGNPITDDQVSVSPDQPLTREVVLPSDAPERGRIGVSLIDRAGGTSYVAMPEREMGLR